MAPNNFDEVLGLEEQFYSNGFQQGMEDGVKAGRIEGRTFGLEKGFEKYIVSGTLYGRSIIWANRIPQLRNNATYDDSAAHSSATQIASRSPDEIPSPSVSLHRLPGNHRLAKHIKVLYALAESESLSTENTEEAVSNFDDRLKRAQGKAKIVDRIIGESKAENECAGLVGKITERDI